MIDEILVLRHGLWIAGAAMAVAGASWNRSIAATHVLLAGAVLFCTGMAAVSRGWMIAAWLVAAAFPIRRWMK